jgi:glycerol-3-phosphate O-acyltransferase/dihydroxyacetone phosphate acyltransferase
LIPRKIHPADRATLFILTVVSATLAVSAASGRPVGGALALHAALLAGFAAVAWVLARRPGAFARGVAVIAVMFTLYTTLGHVAFDAIPWIADPFLATLDEALLLGDSPSLWVDPLGGTGWVELLSVFYAAFIPYLYLSIFLGLVGREPGERDEFITGFAILYALAFLGYLFVPARGPIVHMAAQFATPLAGGPVHALVVKSIDDLGGPHGAFPSLHLGASFFAMWFDFRRRNTLRGLIYVPLVLLIAVATIVLRYHYVVDLIAGVALALLAGRLAARSLKPPARTAPSSAPAPVVREGGLRVVVAANSFAHEASAHGSAKMSAETSAERLADGSSAEPKDADRGRLVYRIARRMWKAALFGFFRRVDAYGRENVPARGPVLLVSNHTNAFVDPLVILTRLRRPVTLTAKSTLRRNPLLKVLMRALNVVELHRSQDVGAGAQMGKNVDSLAELRRRLAEGGAVCIFPEGVSHSDPAMRPFKTGAARIATDFIAQNPSLAIVPVGLHFEAKERFRSAAGLVFGEPFDAGEWLRAHPGADARELTDEIESRIRALTTNFEAERDVETFGRAAELLESANRAPAPLDRDEAADMAGRVRVIHRLQAGRDRLARERQGELSALEGRLAALYAELGRLGITARELFLPMEPGRAAFFVFREMEILLVGFPVALWGMINNLLPYQALKALVQKMSTDRDHWASNAVVMGVVTFPLFWAIQTAAVALLTGSAFWTVVYALALPYSGAVALLYRDRAGGAWRRARTFLRFVRRPAERRRLVTDATEIDAALRRIGAAWEADEAAAVR